MKIGLVGLGKIGIAIAHRVLQSGHKVIGFDINESARIQSEKIGVDTVESIHEIANKTRIIWIMVPAGNPVDKVIKELSFGLKEDDIIIDGGNSNFKNTLHRAKKLKDKNIFLLDCGTSGGLLGEDIGFSLMVGGEKSAYEKVLPIFKAIAKKDGFDYLGSSGAGHYIKMVHNAIEYGLLQAYAEGFNLLKNGRYKNLDLEKISKVWKNGSVIRSWILDLAHDVFKEDQEFENIIGEIQEGGTGRWALEDAKEQDIPVPVLEKSLFVRKESRETGGNYATKLISLIRNKFGGHEVKKNEFS